MPRVVGSTLSMVGSERRAILAAKSKFKGNQIVWKVNQANFLLAPFVSQYHTIDTAETLKYAQLAAMQ